MGAQSSVKLQGDQRAHKMVMEFIRGVNLAEFIREVNAQGKEIPGPLAVFIANRISRGLAYAHGKKKMTKVSCSASCIAMSARAAS